MGAIKSFVDNCRAALTGSIKVKTWWGCNGITGEAFRSWFLERLQDKINRNLKKHPWRKLSQEWQTSLRRDRQRLQDIHNRIIVRQFETALCKQKFGHLLHTN